jgi:hypothetical protein
VAEPPAEKHPEPQAVEAVTTTTVDVHQGPDGVVEIVEQRTEVVNCVAEQAVPPPPQPPAVEEQQPLPQLFDMDLERMHVELHKNRYLTPQDFLGDVGKMVHNAVVCQAGDLERLHRAQAMYTATEVSLQDFDPQFRAECERMGVRERQRRAERKKEKEKAKERSSQEADASGETYAPGTRRSARHNGQQPEIAITDVTKLERAARLKRQRSTGPSNGSQASGDETGEGRDPKRSRVNSEENLPVNSVEPCDSQQTSTVFLSFAQAGPSSVNPNDNGGLLPNVPPSTGGGFDPSLLNPAPSHGDQSPYNRTLSPPSATVEVPPESLAGDSQLPPHSPDPAPVATPHPEQLPISQPGPSDHLPDPTPDAPPTSASPIANKSPAPATPPPEPEAVPIEVDREPTPLPDFHFTQDALTRLADDLRDMTSRLSIEQLEQLRASCLGRIWAHRSEWDRDNLILELGKVLCEFVDEVHADRDDEMLVSP